MQREFEKSGSYQAKRYEDVKPVSREEYNLALLLSFITTIHRFEILESIINFLDRDIDGPQSLLSIGVGTGYEVKLALDYCPDWDLHWMPKRAHN